MGNRRESRCRHAQRRLAARLLAAAGLLLVLAVLTIGFTPRTVHAKKKYTTVYKGVDYARVYNFKYYMKKYPSVRKKVKNKPKKAIKYFVKYGMKKGHRASASFNVKSYYRGNPQLRKKFGKNYKKYYLYYIRGGYREPGAAKTATGVKKMVYESATSAVNSSFLNITSCTISGKNVVIRAAVNGLAKGDTAGLFALPSYTSKITTEQSLKNVTVKGSTVSVTVPLNAGTASSVLQKKFLFAEQNGKTWRIISNYYYIQNPQAAASNRTAVPSPERGTKKGLKSLILTDTYQNKISELGCSHVAVDFPLETFLNGSNFAYLYNGKTYYFSTAVKEYQRAIKKLRDKGIVVTGIFYLSDRSATSYMNPEAARASRGGAATFELNTQNSNRLRLEALFSCLADYFCSDGALVTNWVFSNEINHYSVYNFAGNISYAKRIQYQADSFRMFNTAVKSRYANARTCFSFDHNWNLSFTLSGSYNGRKVLWDLHNALADHGAVHWDLALHPYPSPELDPRIWNRSNLATDSATPQQYTMLNMRKLSAWVKKTYGSGVHIILSETGISSCYQGREMQNEQAAAIAYAYYQAEFDPNIDLIIIHREKSDPSETAAGFQVSLYKDSFSNPKKSVNVFRYMDTSRWNKYTKNYLQYIGKGATWAKLIPGFTGARFK